MTEAEFLRMVISSLHDEIKCELHRRRHPGGQQCGVPRLAGASLGLLCEPERDLRHALEADVEWIATLDKDGMMPAPAAERGEDE